MSKRTPSPSQVFQIYVVSNRVKLVLIFQLDNQVSKRLFLMIVLTGLRGHRNWTKVSIQELFLGSKMEKFSVATFNCLHIFFCRVSRLLRLVFIGRLHINLAQAFQLKYTLIFTKMTILPIAVGNI